MEAVKTNGVSLKYADESFKRDKEIVLTAIKKNGMAFQFVDESFKRDKEFIL